MPTGPETWMPFTFHLVKFSFLQASSDSQNKESQEVTVPKKDFPTESLERADLTCCIYSMTWFYKTPGISTFQEYLSVELGRRFRHMFCPLFQHKYLMSSMLQPLLSKSRKQISHLACCLGGNPRISAFTSLSPPGLGLPPAVINVMGLRDSRTPQWHHTGQRPSSLCTPPEPWTQIPLIY